jgi:hypothetical protein
MGRKKKEKWIQDIHLHRGALHRQLGFPQDERIPVHLLDTILHEQLGATIHGPYKAIPVTPLLKRRASFAKLVRRF